MPQGVTTLRKIDTPLIFPPAIAGGKFELPSLKADSMAARCEDT